MTYTIHHGDCLDVLRAMDGDSVDAVVTDPPYGLSFMGKRWDYDVPSQEIWAECLRVLKPGGHLLAFAGTRTQHRMAVRIEDAGFEIRDMIAWVYGSGFPKSLDVSKAIDREAGAEREKVRIDASQVRNPKATGGGKDGAVGATRPWIEAAMQAGFHEKEGATPATDAARQWFGWGTALKPALEPITVARKPLVGTVAENVLAHGTGGLNIDGCRVGMGEEYDPSKVQRQQSNRLTWEGGQTSGFKADHEQATYNPAGRWPANLIHDGSVEVTGLFPVVKAGIAGKRTGRSKIGAIGVAGYGEQWGGYGDTGSAARFFYCAKASRSDRGEGNGHPTVKPTDLMRYLCRLVTPPGGLVLDPFAGSGSTGKAAVMEGFRFVGIEREAEYVEIARARIAAVAPSLFAAE
jgi:DNA modification methylase